MNERYPNLKVNDPEVYELIQRQAKAESSTLKMIASESYATIEVLEACGSVFTNKYCEGYPGARYYEGNEVTDALENLAIERGKALFGCEHINVQPYSGSPANAAVYRALLNYGDKIMGVPVFSFLFTFIFAFLYTTILITTKFYYRIIFFLIIINIIYCFNFMIIFY